MSYYKDYMDNLIALLNSIDHSLLEKLEQVILEAYENDKTIFVIGNGGSASAASHWACDFSKGTYVSGKKRLKMLSLTDNVALISAISNDISYEEIFVEQLKIFMKEGDVVIGISASGNSLNVVKAIEYCNNNKGISFSIVGFNGGKMKKISRYFIHLKNNNYGNVEDVHMVIDHMVSQKLKLVLSSEAVMN